MPSTGFTLAGTGANNADAGDSAWTDPGSITADDGTNADTSNIGKGETTQYLHATNFGFSLPAAAVPLGIEVRIQRTWLDGEGSEEATDHTVQLIKGGTRSGSNLADLVSLWPFSPTDKDYGGATNLWGNSLTKADVEASTFGVALRVSVGPDPLSDEELAVDAVWINVHYVLAGGNRGYIIG